MKHWIIMVKNTVWKHAHLDIGHFVVGAGGQKELPCRVGELTVVNLLLVLLRESPQQLALFCVPHLKLTGTLILALKKMEKKTAGCSRLQLSCVSAVKLMKRSMTTHLDLPVA